MAFDPCRPDQQSGGSPHDADKTRHSRPRTLFHECVGFGSGRSGVYGGAQRWRKLLGVFSERDVLRRVVVLQRDPSAVKVGDVTSELRAVINCDETPHQALERMELIGTRHLPVVDGERWVGMLTMRDLMRVELSEQGDEIKLLHEYIQH